ncbi:MAG TPA: hypothetical protein DEB71_16140 [Chryseobacterium carnipullorum]|nr:hypothetical protein [Chryseobacterium carnipullorum]
MGKEAEGWEREVNKVAKNHYKTVFIILLKQLHQTVIALKTDSNFQLPSPILHSLSKKQMNCSAKNFIPSIFRYI